MESIGVLMAIPMNPYLEQELDKRFKLFRFWNLIANTNYKYYPSVVELASNCQILVVACALTPETRHIVNREVISALGPKGVLINIGRGPHVWYLLLLKAAWVVLGSTYLKKNLKCLRSSLDLITLCCCPIYVGSGTMETRKAMADLVIGNLEAHFLNNKPLLTPVI